MFLPPIVTLIPLYRLTGYLGLNGSLAGVLVPNLANAFVGTVEQYAVLRLLAGIGLAGELGAGVTLIARTTRSLGAAMNARSVSEGPSSGLASTSAASRRWSSRTW